MSRSIFLEPQNLAALKLPLATQMRPFFHALSFENRELRPLVDSEFRVILYFKGHHHLCKSATTRISVCKPFRD
jgi:hypothetical protein